MSYLLAVPEAMTSVVTNLAQADEVSAAITTPFSQHARGYQTLAGQAAAFHENFVTALTSGAGTYAAAEAVNVKMAVAAATDPIQALLSRPIMFGGGGSGGTGGVPV